MRYTIQSKNPGSHFIDIEAVFDNPGLDEIYLQLPAWRPGRYQLGDFAKNIQQFEVEDESGTELMCGKVAKDRWKVRCSGAKEVHVKYNFYADFINAGSSYVDTEQLYVNPVNCLIYVPGHENNPCGLRVIVPDDYEIATGMKADAKNQFSTKDFDELADSPFMASANMRHHAFEEGGTTFHLWFLGECKPDFNTLESDFRAFTKPQLKMMDGFPVDEYHYLFQIFTHRGYHGVEHCNSTVISIGPSWDVFKKDGWYNELLGVSSHELFHTWNVKRIRPEDWWPYDFSKEGYSRMGYLAEGFTTYYGDLFLYRGGVFSTKTYCEELSKMLNRHFRNPGRLNMSVADSSFDTWLDGYEKGIPSRKTSIYNEGALCSFMMDVAIREETDNESSLDDVVKRFYKECYEAGEGVSEEKFIEVVAGYGAGPASIIEKHVYGTEDYEKRLMASFEKIGFNVEKTPANKVEEAMFGLLLEQSNSVVKVDNVLEGSPAEKAGLGRGTELLAINDIPVKNEISEWIKYFRNDQIALAVKQPFGKIEGVSMQASDEVFLYDYKVSPAKEMTKKQSAYFEKWGWRAV